MLGHSAAAGAAVELDLARPCACGLLVLPTAASNLAFAVVYYVIVRLGFDISDLFH